MPATNRTPPVNQTPPANRTPPAPEVPADGTVRLSDLLCFSLYSASHAFTRFYKPMLNDLGLTYPQYLVLLALWERDGRSVGELGAYLGLETNTLTPLLKSLERQGHVTRARSDRDERVVEISLTPAGRALEDPAKALPACAFASADMPLAEIRRLTAEIDSLTRALRGAASE